MKHLFRVGDRVYDRFHMKAGMIIRAEDEYEIEYDDGGWNRSVNGTQYVLIDPSTWTLVTVVSIDEALSEGATTDTTVPKSTNHPDKILLWICIGHNEGPQAHMHIFRSDPNTVPWDDSITLCLNKNEYFHDPKNKPKHSKGFNPKLTTKEAKLLVKHLNKTNPKNNQTWWKTLIGLWNSKNHILEDDIKKGWVPLDTDIPPYDKFIKD